MDLKIEKKRSYEKRSFENETLKNLVLKMYDKNLISIRERDRYLGALYKTEKVSKYDSEEERKKNKSIQSQKSIIRRELMKILKIYADFEK